MSTAGQPATVPGSRIGRRLAPVHRAVEAVELAVGCLLITLVLAMVVLQAAQRYLPVSGWAWTGELARYALVWLTFALAGYLTGRGEHIGLELVDYLARGRLLALVRRFADAALAAIAAAFTVDAWSLVTAATGRTSPVTGIPLPVLYLVPVAGFALTAVRAGWSAVAGRPCESRDTADAGGRG
jgi:TRAP-type C4-dicarboxylate transport system permease small subunit